MRIEPGSGGGVFFTVFSTSSHREATCDQESTPWTRPDAFEASDGEDDDLCEMPPCSPSCGGPARLDASREETPAGRTRADERESAGAGAWMEQCGAPMHDLARGSCAGASPRAGQGCRPGSTGPSDPRLLTAGMWDSARVKAFPTPSPILGEALRHLGLRYAWQGTDLQRGVDCSGFAWQVYNRSGRHVPLHWFREGGVDARTHPERLEREGMRHVDSPQPGDVVIFGSRHVGIYAGELNGHGLYIGANHGGPSQAGRVDIQTISSYYGMKPTYFRYSPKKIRPPSSRVRSNTVRTSRVTSPPAITALSEAVHSSGLTR